ncbi:TetR/AcrR family transcriptional regulator [Tissierella sp. MSJ-40]|uniref:TetR/AcrR family transcriptional regulator n=1 Tax=Tissierella simiarum TaxID=2841534 RepID=A0ABS6EAB0_9FIRM|nr:TetR/AcrR family transcriptional regulator [Tissierella simiarum]MBU5439875.1 TetR/AcrR family transcriptional regulator [Tissierella simiarum]
MAREVFKKLAEDKKNTIIKSGICEFSKKSYSEASTDIITRNCGISKGILFYYFGSKKEFYFYCLEKALERLITELPELEVNDFYGIIFSFIEEKFNLCREFPEEMRIVNMAARETNSQISERRNEVLAKYMIKGKEKSAKVMGKAVAALNLKEEANTEKVTAALTLYIGAIINKYLEIYKEMPGQFFKQSEEIKAEIRACMDFMLYGVVKEESE